MNVYRLYDFVLAAGCELPELERAAGPPDLTLAFDVLPSVADRWEDLWRLDQGEPWIRMQRVDGGYRIRYVDQVDFEYSIRQRTIVAEILDCPVATFRHFLLDQVVPLILSLEAVVLHASAAVMGDRVVAFIGRGGAGKSMLAALLDKRGHAVAADDGMLIRLSADGLMGVPPYPGLRLWPEAFPLLRQPTVTASELVTASASKRRVREGLRLDDCPRRIECVFLLDATASSRVTVEALNGRERVVALLEHSFCLERRAGSYLVEHMERVCASATILRAWRLRYPRRQDCWPALIEAIETRTASSTADGFASAAT